MKTFAVFYNSGVSEGLSLPNGAEEIAYNQKVMKERLSANWAQLEAAKVLEGLTVHSRQMFVGALCVSGPPEKIDQLKVFLEGTSLGTVVPNTVSIKGAGVA